MNRRAFTQRRSELEESATPHWLLLFDVDNFKRINDNWGTLWGRRALPGRRAAGSGAGQWLRLPDRGRRVRRPVALVAQRAGGRLTRLLARVRNQQWREFREAVTLSVGGAHSPDDGVLLFERADECLYRSKRLGRDGWSLTERTRQEQGADRSCHMDNG